MTPRAHTLILVRHAKSSWADAGLPDHERPLNARGRRDAPRMARRLAERGPHPRKILTSSAARALATAMTFASELDLDDPAVVVKPEIYGAGVTEIVDLIRGLDDELECVMVVGHNPTFSALVDRLTGRTDVGNVPTCGVVTLELGTRPWAGVTESTLLLADFDFPKKDSH